jgi:hypothetical protein
MTAEECKEAIRQLVQSKSDEYSEHFGFMEDETNELTELIWTEVKKYVGPIERIAMRPA